MSISSIQPIKLFTPIILALLLMAIPAMTARTAAQTIGKEDLGAFIREGTCQEPGKVIEDIGDLDHEHKLWKVIGKDGETAPDQLFGEDEDIDFEIADLIANNYIVTIHSKDDANAPIIACGVIEGDIDSSGTLLIELDEMNDSGVVGRVHFGPSDDDEDEPTEATTGVWLRAAATPEATPAG